MEAGPFSTTPVGMYPAGRSLFGVDNMACNVQEYVAGGYTTYPGANRTDDHLTPSRQTHRITRGGSFTAFGDLARDDNREDSVAKQTDEVVFANFYTTPRASAPLLSDGGGPFGFDIQAALQFDYIVRNYPVSHIIETGCCLGDTTDYLARTYPHIPLWTCDVDARFASFSTERLRRYPHVQVVHGDSAQLLSNVLDDAWMPLLYLDAHWGGEWPLARELKSVRRGIVVVDDFDVGNPRFGFDVYNGVACDIDFIVDVRPDIEAVYIGNPGASYDYPCLQVGRRAGRCYLPIDVSADSFEGSEMFQRITTKRAEQ